MSLLFEKLPKDKNSTDKEEKIPFKNEQILFPKDVNQFLFTNQYNQNLLQLQNFPYNNNIFPNFEKNSNDFFNEMTNKFSFFNISETPYNQIQNYLQNINRNDFTFTHNAPRFFVIKSYNESNVIYALKNGVWCSTKKGNRKLNSVFLEDIFRPIYLFFSINESGNFQGVAQMISPVNENDVFPAWAQNNKWKGLFQIKWIFVKTIPNEEFRKFRNTLNENKPIPNSRDTQEISMESAIYAMELFKNFQTSKTLLKSLK